MPPKRKRKPPPKIRREIKPKFEIRVLDHLALCGPRTRATGMFLVRETHPDLPTKLHQIFRDHHGTYCSEHGKTCPAIPAVEKQ